MGRLEHAPRQNNLSKKVNQEVNDAIKIGILFRNCSRTAVLFGRTRRLRYDLWRIESDGDFGRPATEPQKRPRCYRQKWRIRPSVGAKPTLLPNPINFLATPSTLTSMLAFTREQVVHNVKGLSQQDLDFLLDAKANTMGALLLHLAATETYYQMNTFGGMSWGSWSDEVKKKWDIPMNLGEPARKAIKGNSLDYYLDALHQVREKSLAEFRTRDDKWLATLVTQGDIRQGSSLGLDAGHQGNRRGCFP